MKTTSININVSGSTQTFNIGESETAQSAISSYNRYQADHKYENLKECFANLHWTVNKDPERKLNACLACHAVASSVYSPELSVYKRFFIANSVSSIIANANLGVSLSQIRTIWETIMTQSGQEITRNGFDMQAAEEAGLAVKNLKN